MPGSALRGDVADGRLRTDAQLPVGDVGPLPVLILAGLLSLLREQGREGEAWRFELMHRNLPPVRSEKQLIAESLLARRTPGTQRAHDPARLQ